MIRRTQNVIVFAAFYLLPFAIPLTQSCDETEERLYCARICAEYDNCIDDDIDVSACTDSCEERADNRSELADDVERCETCIDDRACVENVFQCADACAGVVPAAAADQTMSQKGRYR